VQRLLSDERFAVDGSLIQSHARIEEAFGWMKTFGGMAKSSCAGIASAGWSFTFTAAAFNLVRLGNPLSASA